MKFTKMILGFVLLFSQITFAEEEASEAQAELTRVIAELPDQQSPQATNVENVSEKIKAESQAKTKSAASKESLELKK